MNKRELNLKKLGISGSRYKELCGFCEQYPTWKDELLYKTSTVKSPLISDMPKSAPSQNATENLAIRRAELSKKCELIEQSAIAASADLYPYILKSVCYRESLQYLHAIMEMPCSRATFYDVRRCFFYILDKNKKT